MTTPNADKVILNHIEMCVDNAHYDLTELVQSLQDTLTHSTSSRRTFAYTLSSVADRLEGYAASLRSQGAVALSFTGIFEEPEMRRAYIRLLHSPPNPDGLD